MVTTRRVAGPLRIGAGIAILLVFSMTPRLLADGGSEATENLARGAKYRLDPPPTYKYCTDPGDAVQLTDGQSTGQYFWTQPGTVGWQRVPYATVTVDLGRIEPIDGASLTTAAGVAGVTWPVSIPVLVSDDGGAWYDAGDLVALDHRHNGPWPDGYAIRKLETRELAAHGRYVRFMLIPLPGAPYLFCDEVEVYRGPNDLLDREPAGPPVEAKSLFENGRIERSVRLRFERDSRSLAAEIEQAEFRDEAMRERLVNRVAVVRQQLNAASVKVDGAFRAVLPIGETHARLFAIQAELWRARGMPPVAAWATDAWDPLELIAMPPADRRSTIDICAMRNERRVAAVNVANSTASPITFRVRLIAKDDAAERPRVTVHEVEWTDTSQGQPVAAALPEAGRDGDAWTIAVLPGMIRQVWLTVNTADLEAGTYPLRLQLESGDRPAAGVDVDLTVWPLRFPDEPQLLVGGWSYTDGAGRYGLTAENRRAFVEHLQSRYVNAPWATSAVMRGYAFTADDPLQVQLDTQAMDDWIAQWPNARRYMVFLSVAHYSGSLQSSFGGAEIGSSEFNRRVGAWISAWVSHLGSKGVTPDRLGLLIHDEPHEGSDIGPLLAWARAIRAAEPDVLIWEDPTYKKPAAAPAEVFEVCDVLCPNRPMWLSGGDAFARFYGDQRDRGRELQFYSCSGPARLLDPYTYYRLQAWQCWKAGATGSFFWAFGDNGRASSWNEYLATSGPYTPLFLDKSTVTAGKQMEAVRESVQDYEYFVMLEQAIREAKAAGRSDAAVDRGWALLETAAGEVLDAEAADELLWHVPKDRRKADSVRRKIAEAIVAIRASEND